MEFIHIALRLENEAIRNYQELADKCVTHEGIRRILLMLAADHEKHVETLSKMKDVLHFDPEDSPTFKEASRLFSSMRHDKETFSCDVDQLRLYQEARDLLQKKSDFYQEMSTGLSSQAAKAALQKLLAEENKQIKVLDNIIEMVSRPQNWLENAEFFHLEEY